MLYAQIDENNICVAESSLRGEVVDPQLIPIEEADKPCIGKTWNEQTQEWEA